MGVAMIISSLMRIAVSMSAKSADTQDSRVLQEPQSTHGATFALKASINVNSNSFCSVTIISSKAFFVWPLLCGDPYKMSAFFLSKSIHPNSNFDLILLHFGAFGNIFKNCSQNWAKLKKFQKFYSFAPIRS